jgi:uncharacterized protein YgfB (UPF0149 family)
MPIIFSDAVDLWDEAGCHQSPSALHGWISGYLATGARLKPEAWLAEAKNYLELETALENTMAQLVAEMYTSVLEKMSSEDMDYGLMLPSDEDADVSEQVECLAQWSKGFLDGFGASGQRISGASLDSMEGVQEVLRDLDAFSMVDSRDLDDSNASMYLELVEHARVAALTVFYSMNRAAPVSTLH